MSTCLACGEPLETRRSTRRYCSARCRLAFFRLRSVSVSSPLWPERDERAGGPLSFGPSSDAAQGPSAQPGPAPAPQRWPDAALEHIAARIPSPVDVFGPARAYCIADAAGFRVVFGLDSGRRDEPVGPLFDRPRDAIRLSEVLNERIAPRAAA